MTTPHTEITLNNGLKIPIIGMGTWKIRRDQALQVITDAINVGYRHFDCAYIYLNEKEIGDAIAQEITKGTVKREDLFITSKLWNTFHRPNLVRKACKITLNNLKLEYLDLYLIQWPMAYREDGEVHPADDNGRIAYSTVDYVDTWVEMEKLVNDGLCKSIGLSNFNSQQILRLLEVARITPTINQIECHPYLNQAKLIEFCKERNIAITAYSPLGAPGRPGRVSSDPVIMEDKVILNIARKYKRSPAQILIRYQIQRGLSVIPKSANKERMKSNINVFDFHISNDDMNKINKINRDLRFFTMSLVRDHPHHPFATEEY